jgi:hypothetical protein
MPEERLLYGFVMAHTPTRRPRHLRFACGSGTLVEVEKSKPDLWAGETFGRVIGKRAQSRVIGEVPNAEDRAAVASFPHGVRAPRGVFRYRSHEEANADWERWQAERLASSNR